MWQLPRQSLWKRSRRAVTVTALVWALAAIPLVAWLALRTPPPAAAPEWRALTPVESAAVRYGGQALRTEPVSLTSTVTSPMAQLRVEETVDPARSVSTGVVRSGSETADMMAVGGRVLLRGGAPFWATLGVPTSEPGWVDVGDRLGVRVTFPLDQAAAAMVPGPQSQISGNDPSSPTFRNGSLTAVFGGEGISALTFSGRTASVARPGGEALAKLAGVPPPDWEKSVATLSGSGGALTVTPATPPPPGESDDAKPAP